MGTKAGGAALAAVVLVSLAPMAWAGEERASPGPGEEPANAGPAEKRAKAEERGKDKEPKTASAAAGETVEFELADTLEGAQYLLTIGEQQVHSGTDTDQRLGVRDEFEMPDLGEEARKVVVNVDIAEADGTTRSTAFRVDYLGHAAPPPPESPPPAPQPGAEPRSASAPVSLQPAVTITPPVDALEAQPEPEAAPPAGASVPKRADGLPTGGAAPEGATRTEASDRSRAEQARQERKPERKQRRRANPDAGEQLPLAQPAPPKPAPPAPEPLGGADLSSDEFAGVGYRVAWQLLAGAALGGLLLMVLIGTRARRRRACV